FDPATRQALMSRLRMNCASFGLAFLAHRTCGTNSLQGLGGRGLDKGIGVRECFLKGMDRIGAARTDAADCVGNGVTNQRLSVPKRMKESRQRFPSLRAHLTQGTCRRAASHCT